MPSFNVLFEGFETTPGQEVLGIPAYFSEHPGKIPTKKEEEEKAKKEKEEREEREEEEKEEEKAKEKEIVLSGEIPFEGGEITFHPLAELPKGKGSEHPVITELKFYQACATGQRIPGPEAPEHSTYEFKITFGWGPGMEGTNPRNTTYFWSNETSAEEGKEEVICSGVKPGFLVMKSPYGGPLTVTLVRQENEGKRAKLSKMIISLRVNYKP